MNPPIGPGRLLLMICFAGWLGGAASAQENSKPPFDERAGLLARAAEGIDLLDHVYWSTALGIWLDQPGGDLRAHFDGRRNPPWWVSANTVELIIDLMKLRGTSEHDPALETMYTLWKDPAARRARVVAELKRRGQWTAKDDEELARRTAKRPLQTSDVPAYYTNFQNEYLDDSGWWALAWLKMYDRTKETRYRETARTIHAHMARNWRPDKGGGILWCEDEDKQRPNSITNNLFLILSARLYSRAQEPEYLRWAEKTLEWIRATGLYDGAGMVDGPGHQGDYWTYNQGAFIGGLTALFLATDRKEYLEEAARFTETVLQKSGLVLPNGVLVEKIGTGGDATLFKGVMARYLAEFQAVLRERGAHPELSAEILRVLHASAKSLQEMGPASNGLFQAGWHADAKEQRTNFGSHVAALMALAAAAAL